LCGPLGFQARGGACPWLVKKRKNDSDLRAEVEREPFSWARQGEVSMTMGSFPPWEASSRDSSNSAPFPAAASLNPLLLNIMPQQLLLRFCTQGSDLILYLLLDYVGKYGCCNSVTAAVETSCCDSCCSGSAHHIYSIQPLK